MLSSVRPLGFIDHHRQRYAERVPIDSAGEFQIGDYLSDGSLGTGGGFTVALVELGSGGRWACIRICAYSETASRRCVVRLPPGCWALLSR